MVFNGDVSCFLWGTDWILKCYFSEICHSKVNQCIMYQCYDSKFIVTRNKLSIQNEYELLYVVQIYVNYTYMYRNLNIIFSLSEYRDH
jgi:hypothetical protein